MSYKTVLYPIEVPDGDHCWVSSAFPTPICKFFNNEGGLPSCELGFYPVIATSDGIVKAPKCKSFLDDCEKLSKDLSSIQNEQSLSQIALEINQSLKKEGYRRVRKK